MANFSSRERVSTLKGFEGIPSARVESYSLDSYLKNTNGQMSFKFNPNAWFNKRLVLFGTSSFNTRLDVYQCLFTEVIFIRSPYIIEEMVLALEPDVVLTSNAERHLYNVPNSQNDTPWFLKYITPNFDSSLIPKTDYIAWKALFSRKESSLYIDRFGKRLSGLPRNLDKLKKINQSDINSIADVFFLRDMAIHIEKTDLELAKHLMGLAHQARPEGKLIKSKLESYMSKQL